MTKEELILNPEELEAVFDCIVICRNALNVFGDQKQSNLNSAFKKINYVVTMNERKQLNKTRK